MVDVIIFDTETTDLISNTGLPLRLQPKVIEIYAKKIHLDPGKFGGVEDWEDVSDINFLVNPMVPIPKESSDITGITDDMVKGCDPISVVWPHIVDFFKGANFMVAHNLAFDRQIMAFEQKRIDENSVFPFPKGQICTVESTMHLKGHRLNLQALHELLLGERFEAAHRAKNDVLALERCFKVLWERGEI
jgi:DNA polymerase III alpha subunit (gram-positive type)